MPAHASRTGDRFLYQDRVVFVCDDGYYQSSGPDNGVRECLVTGEWSDTQPVCSREFQLTLTSHIFTHTHTYIHFAGCGEIASCQQVLCTNASNHYCLQCESDNGPLPGESAYSNLGTQCQGNMTPTSAIGCC